MSENSENGEIFFATHLANNSHKSSHSTPIMQTFRVFIDDTLARHAEQTVKNIYQSD